MALRYDETALWCQTLGSAGATTREESALATLRSTFETAHDRIKPIVRQAHVDCRGLTIHDESHLDALWQLATTIAGDEYPINPLEAFVFGCSVLFHDSALAVAAYEGGLEGIKQTREWKQAISQLTGGTDPSKRHQKSDDIPKLESAALFSVLRSLHAKQAAAIVEREWERPDGKPPISILEDTEIRDYYGQIIGRIAQSHHWDIDRVAREFSTRRVPPPSLPSEWELNELKIALLLRCSDAAHIDQRRAPLMEYILANPKGISALHWNFQNRLGTPKQGDRSILYNSGRDFGRSEADAWWLCFDTCKMISEELQNAAAVLKESDTQPFYASRVEGAQRPKLFAKYVHCDGWEPVDAEVRVSDPISLAQTLGGKNLYGTGYHAPVREMLQNAIDATALRSSIGREGYVPKVRLTLDKGQDGRICLIVEDNGIGMSERVLTRRLLDFGRSGWRSDDVAQDNPEISTSSAKVGGRFGIGFFAVFLLGEDVSVVTRQYKNGIGDGLALEFVGLSRRPILRKATSEEQSDVYTTRVIVSVSDEEAVRGLLPKPPSATPISSLRIRYGSHRPWAFDDDFFVYLKWLSVSCNIEIDFSDKIANRSFKHTANWSARSSEEFIKDIAPPNEGADQPDYAALYSERLTNLTDDDGKVVGRAAILLDSRDARASNVSLAMVGGLTYPTYVTALTGASNTSVVPRYVGIMEGEAVIATRGQAQLAITPKSLANWATGQAEAGTTAPLSILEKIELARAVYWCGGDPRNLPMAYFEGVMIDLPTLKKALSDSLDIFLPLTPSGSRDEHSWYTMDDLRVRFFVDQVTNGACIMNIGSRETIFSRLDDGSNFKLEPNSVIDETMASKIRFGSYDILIDLIKKSGRNYSLRYEPRRIFTQGLNIGRVVTGLAIIFDSADEVVRSS
jgi:hypothetical protein